MVNQNIDKILIPELVPADQKPMEQLGIYGANYKLAVIMNMFIQGIQVFVRTFLFQPSEKPVIRVLFMPR